MFGVTAAVLLVISGAPNTENQIEFVGPHDVESLRRSLAASLAPRYDGPARVRVEPRRDPTAPLVYDLAFLAVWPGEVHREAGCVYATIDLIVGTSTYTVTAEAPDVVRLFTGRRELEDVHRFKVFRKLASMVGEPPETPPEPIAIDASPVFVETDAPTWVDAYLAPLGGVQLSWTGGVATVRSDTRVEGSRETETVGSGRATSRGYRISLYDPPSESGFFWPPAIGFFSQEITISGFSEELAQVNVPGSETIGAVATDPLDGQPIDLSEPIAYRLHLRSGYLGQTFGFHLVGDLGFGRPFATAQVGVNVLELRHTDVTVHTSRVKGFSFAFFGSGNASGELGIAFDDLHFAIVASAQLEVFSGFSYPRSLEFLASARYDPDKQIYERKRSLVDGALVVTFDWQISAVVLF